MTPQGWEEKTLGEILDKGSSNLSANKLDKGSGSYPVYGASGLAAKVDFYQQDSEYLAIIKDGAGVGRVYHYEPKTSVLGTLQYLHPKQGTNIRFAYYYLQSIDFAKYYQGAAIPHIYYRDYKNEKLVLPPLPEQQRIVAKLDKAFEAIDKVKANAEQNLNNAKELFESTLYSLCNDKKANWTTGRLDNYFVLQRGFDLPKQDRKKGQYPLVSSNGITDFIDTYKIKRPVVVTGRSGTIGSVHYVDENSWPLNTTLYVKDFKDNVPKYIFYYLKSLNLAEYSSGAGVPTLNRNYIHEIIISFPLQSEQQKIVEKLDVLQEQTKQLQAIYTKKIKECDELKQSILQKAFRGEL